jgi:hypothetical protein
VELHDGQRRVGEIDVMVVRAVVAACGAFLEDVTDPAERSDRTIEIVRKDEKIQIARVAILWLVVHTLAQDRSLQRRDPDAVRR